MCVIELEKGHRFFFSYYISSLLVILFFSSQHMRICSPGICKCRTLHSGTPVGTICFLLRTANSFCLIVLTAADESECDASCCQRKGVSTIRGRKRNIILPRSKTAVKESRRTIQTQTPSPNHHETEEHIRQSRFNHLLCLCRWTNNSNR